MSIIRTATHTETQVKYNIHYFNEYYAIPQGSDVKLVAQDLSIKNRILPGLYTHYKNKPYEVVTDLIDLESGQTFVLYQALYGEKAFWLRPKDMFQELVEFEGKTVARFKYESE